MPWDQPDYNTSEVIDYVSLHAQIRSECADAMMQWPYEGPKGFDKETVKRYCVDTKHDEVAEWQRVRLSMKGKKTHEKLAILKAWWDKHIITSEIPAGVVPMRRTAHGYAVYVQVYNYLGALRRGGQLDDNNRIRKYI